MATPNLSTECTARCVFPYSDERGYSVKNFFYEDDDSQAELLSSTEHSDLDLRFETQTDAQKASFLAFVQTQFTTNWAVNKGVFYWNDPRTGVTDIKVRFKDDDFKVKYVADSPTTWSWNVALKRVRS